MHEIHPEKLPLGRPFAPTVDKISVTLPFGSYTAVPGNPEDGGGIVSDEVTGTTAINTYEQALTTPSPLPLSNHVHGIGPPVAIAIANDSPIDCCDLWFGTPGGGASQRYRVGVGSPLIGLPSDLGQVFVTMPRMMPDPFDGSGEASQTWLAENDVFDAQRGLGQTSISPLNDRAEIQIPIRLVVFRGAAPQIMPVRRAPYYADAYYSMTGAGVAYKRLWICTMGRQSIEVVVSNLGVNPLLFTVEGHDPTLISKGGAFTSNQFVRKRVGVRFDAGALAVGETFKNSYTEPFTLYSVRIDHGGAATKVAIAIATRDA